MPSRNYGKKVVRNYFYNTAYQLLMMVAPLVTAPYVSRVLGAAGVGVFNYAHSVSILFTLLGTVGTSLYGQREIAFVQNKPEERSRIFWQIAIFRFVTVFACTAAFYCIFGLGEQYSLVYQILTIEVLATAFDISWFLMGMEEFRVTAVRSIIVKLVGITMVFLLVKTPEDVPWYTLCIVLPSFVGNLCLWFSLPKFLVKVRVTAAGIVRHIRPTLILFLPQLAADVYEVLDKTMLGLLATDIAEVGYYSQASRIVKLSLTIVTSIGTVMLPAMSHAFAEGKRDVIVKGLQASFRFVFMLGFALLFGLCGVATHFVPLFFGPGYDKVAVLMVVISPIVVMIAMSTVIGKQYLLPTKQQKAFTASVMVGAAVNCVLNAILIVRYNAIGASVATVIAELAVLAVQMAAIRKQLDLWQCLKPGLKYLLLGAAMGGVVYAVGQLLGNDAWVVVVQIVVGAAFYLLELIVTKDELLLEARKRLLKARVE